MKSSDPVIVRVVRGSSKLMAMGRLQLANSLSRRRIVGDSEVTVSLTTFGSRLKLVHLAIESIARGRSKPKTVILWLDDPELFAKLPSSLRRLQKRGLDIRLTKNYGPHTKYFPSACAGLARGGPLVTADDDTIYPVWWLDRLVKAHRARTGAIICHRARVMSVSDEGRLTPYNEWPNATSSQASPFNFFLGVSGVLYPTSFVEVMERSGEAFMDVCRHADDIWLNYLAVREGFSVTQVGAVAGDFPLILFSQKQALSSANLDDRRNDRYIENLFTGDVVRTILGSC